MLSRSWVLKLCLVCLAVHLSACNTLKKRHDHTESFDAKALSLAGFDAPSFGALSAENHCQGIKTFFNDYQKMYLKDVQLESLSASGDCAGDGLDNKPTDYKYRFSLKKNNHFINMIATVRLDDQAQSAQGTICREIDGSCPAYNFQLVDSIIDLNLMHLVSTFESWVQIQAVK